MSTDQNELIARVVRTIVNRTPAPASSPCRLPSDHLWQLRLDRQAYVCLLCDEESTTLTTVSIPKKDEYLNVAESAASQLGCVATMLAPKYFTVIQSSKELANAVMEFVAEERKT